MRKSKTEVSVATVNLFLNKAARNMFGEEAQSVRVRILDDALLVRPTLRTKGLSNLPKTDKMIPLSRSATKLKFSVPMSGVESGAMFLVEELRYGWTRFTSVAANSVGRDAAVAKVVSA